MCRNNTNPLIASEAKSPDGNISISELAHLEDSSPTHHNIVTELSKEVLKSLDHPGALEGNLISWLNIGSVATLVI